MAICKSITKTRFRTILQNQNSKDLKFKVLRSENKTEVFNEYDKLVMILHNFYVEFVGDFSLKIRYYHINHFNLNYVYPRLKGTFFINGEFTNQKLTLDLEIGINK